MDQHADAEKDTCSKTRVNGGSLVAKMAHPLQGPQKAYRANANFRLDVNRAREQNRPGARRTNHVHLVGLAVVAASGSTHLCIWGISSKMFSSQWQWCQDCKTYHCRRVLFEYIWEQACLGSVVLYGVRIWLSFHHISERTTISTILNGFMTV